MNGVEAGIDMDRVFLLQRDFCVFTLMAERLSSNAFSLFSPFSYAV